jgi:hypothetical protein
MKKHLSNRSDFEKIKALKRSINKFGDIDGSKQRKIDAILKGPKDRK